MKRRREKEPRPEQEAWARAQRVLADSGASGEGFGEPRGWALKWDGASLPEDREAEEEGTPSRSQSAL